MSVNDTVDLSSYIPGPPNPTVDTTLSVIYIICSLIGIPGNILAVVFFHGDVSTSKRKEFFRLIFLLIAYINLVTCSTLSPVIEVLFKDGRSETGAMFGENWICWCWGILWEFIPFYSVFLLGVMSISRMFTLLLPLKELADKGILIAALTVYMIYTLMIKTVPLAVFEVQYSYTSTCGFCFFTAQPSSAADRLYNITNVLQLGFPFIPIFLSCASSIYLVRRKRVQHRNLKKTPLKMRRKSTTQVMLENATITIIVMTTAYVVFNIPVFINYLYYLAWAFSGRLYSEYYDTVLLYQYLWNISWVLCMAGNAALNPIIYFWRIASYRSWIMDLGGSMSANSYTQVTRQAAV